MVLAGANACSFAPSELAVRGGDLDCAVIADNIQAFFEEADNRLDLVAGDVDLREIPVGIRWTGNGKKGGSGTRTAGAIMSSLLATHNEYAEVCATLKRDAG
jgi:hypothetical protein